MSATSQTAILDLTLLRPETDPTAVVNFIAQQGWSLQELTRPHTNLESLFLQKLREAEAEAQVPNDPKAFLQ